MFAVFPSVAIGRTPVVIRITDSNKLDYEDLDRRVFIFKVKNLLILTFVNNKEFSVRPHI